MDFITTLLQICGGISVIGGAVTLIVKMLNPYKTLKNKVDKHEVLLEKDLERLNRFEETDRILCSCLHALLDHGITGNSYDEMKKAKENLNRFLINK